MFSCVIKATLLTSRKDAERRGDTQHPALADPRPITGLQRNVSTSPGEQAERPEVGQEPKLGPQRRGLAVQAAPRATPRDPQLHDTEVEL